MGTIIFKALASEVIENYLKPTRHFLLISMMRRMLRSLKTFLVPSLRLGMHSLSL
ncbi:hypothetical protein ACWATR_01500 [Nostoc sp. UIC 10890]